MNGYTVILRCIGTKVAEADAVSWVNRFCLRGWDSYQKKLNSDGSGRGEAEVVLKTTASASLMGTSQNDKMIRRLGAL